MKLLLALSVVLVTLFVLAEPTSASEDQSLSSRFQSFGETIKDAFKTVGEKTKEAVEGLHKSEIGKKTTNFFKETIQKIKDKFSN